MQSLVQQNANVKHAKDKHMINFMGLRGSQSHDCHFTTITVNTAGVAGVGVAGLEV